MSMMTLADAPVILLALAALVRIGCIGVDAKLHKFNGSRERFGLLALSYAILFIAIVAQLIGYVFAPQLAIVAMASWVFIRRNPFGRD